MFKMYLKDIEWSAKNAPCRLIFGNAKDGGLLSVEISGEVGFDLRTILNQKRSGIIPYVGVCELVRQLDGKIHKLMIRDGQKSGTALVQLEVFRRIKEVELFFADAVSIAIILDLPIYFDEVICAKREASLWERLRWSRTENLTNYSFDTFN